MVYYAFDERGNVSQRTGSAGAVTGSDLYDGYGARQGTVPTQPDPFGYGGQWGSYTDAETGLVLCTHRFYDPQAGRFVTRDPIGYAGGVNLYGYTQNNPVNESDPSGYIGEGVLPPPVYGPVNAGWAAALALAAAAALAADYLHNHPIHWPTVAWSPPWSGPTTVPRQIPPPPPIIQNRRGSKPVEKLRKEWEKLTGRTWPKDENGKNKVCEHKVPLADGGADDGENVEPLDKEVHKQQHKDRGDFKRWGARSGQGTPED